MQFFIDHQLGLNQGADFGKGGEGFMRLNVGLSKKLNNLLTVKIKNILNQSDF